MVSSPKPPAPTPPERTAAAQTATNIGTAIANQVGSQTAYSTPYGEVTYGQTGTYKYTDPLAPNNVYDIPMWTQYTELNPTGQKIFDAEQATSVNLANLAETQSGKLNTLLSNPLQMTNEAAENRLMELGRARLDPGLATRRSAVETQLAQQGIKRGSAAHSAAITELQQGENDAYNQLMLSGRAQAMNELTAERNQQINEPIALMTGAQVQTPPQVAAPGYQQPFVDYAGIVANYDNQRMQGYQMQQQASAAKMGGLFSAGSALLRLPFMGMGGFGPTPGLGL